MLFACVILLLWGGVSAGTVNSNIPIIVSSNKNYTTAAPTWLTSPFFRAGNEAVITTLTGNNTTPTYTFTFSSALPGLPNLAYGIKNYRGNDYFGQEFYEIKKIGLTPSTFQVSIQIYGFTNLWLLTVAYLAVDPSFPHHLNSFDNVPINYTAGDIVNITTMKSQLAYYTNYINYTDQATGLSHNQFTTPLSSNKIVLFMTSFWVRGTFGTAPDYMPVKFHVYTGVVNSSHYFWNATLETQCLVTNVHFSQIIFNSDDVQSSNQYFIVYATWINDLNGGFLEIPQEFTDNFIMGVTTFETVDAHCGFEYQWEFTNGTVNGSLTFGVELLYSWTLTNTCGFSWSESSIFYMETWRCDPPFHYFNLTSGLCQTLCGGYTYENPLTFTCEPCVNTLCYQCTDPSKDMCTECSSSLFYELVNDSCVCMSGYFPANSQCLPCSSGSTGCLNCSYDDGNNGTLPYNTSIFSCDACASGYLFISGSCYTCAVATAHCITCDYTANASLPYDPTAMACTACDATAGYFLDTNSNNTCMPCTLPNCAVCGGATTCAVCNAGFGVTVTGGCSTCPILGCQTCFNLTVCSVCTTGYTEIGGLCYTCSSSCTCGGYTLPKYSNGDCSTVCGDGIVIFPYEGCDDGNTADGDGCSAKCAVQPLSSCSSQPSLCYFTSTLSLTLIDTAVSATVCNQLTFRFQLTPSLSLANNPAIDWSTVIVSQNTSAMTLLSSQYSNGVASLSYTFSRTLQGQSVVFALNPQNMGANTYLHYTTASVLTATVVPSNNVAAVYVDGSVCASEGSGARLLQAEAGVAYFGLLLSVFSGKIVGLQMFGVLQLSFFALGNYDYVPSALIGALRRSEVNGLNVGGGSSEGSIPSRVSSNGVTASDFLSNINIMLLLTVAIAITGGVMYLATYIINKDSIDESQSLQQNPSKSVDQEQTRSMYLHRISKYLLKEVLLTFIIFNMFNISYSAGIQIQYINEVSTFSIICLLATFALIITVTIAQIATSKEEFGEYIDKFKPEQLQSKYMIATIVYRFTLGFLLATINEWVAGGIVLTFVSGAFLSYICYFEPFNDGFQNLRSKFIHCVHVLILFVNYYYRVEANSDAGQSSQLQFPAYLQMGAVAVSVVGSTTILAYEFVKKYLLKSSETAEVPKESHERLKPKTMNQELTVEDFS